MWLRANTRAAKRATEFEDDVLVGNDPTLDALKARYRDLFRVAFERAVARLAPHERTLLRQVVIDRVAVEDIAALHGVHRVTASRWLQRIRRALLDATRAELAGQIDATPEELDSVWRLIDSNLEASVERVLRSQG